MIYLDNASTSWPKPPQVAEAMVTFIREQAGSPGRTGHLMAEQANKLMLEVRTKLARLIHATDPNRMILCLNATDALNMAMKGTLLQGDHVICSDLDHNSVSRPLNAMVESSVISLTRLPITGQGLIDPDAVRAAIMPNTKLIVINHASNVTGVIQPAREVGRIAQEHDVLYLLDAAQTAGLLDIDVNSIGADMVAFPGHKSLLGPTGTGVLYVGPKAKLKPWREGGTGADSATVLQPVGFPVHLEAGTPNTVGLAGLIAALDVLDPEANLAHECKLGQQLCDAISEHPNIRVSSGWKAHRSVATVSVTVDGFAPDEVGAILDESFGIAIRPGLHCAPYVHRAMGTFPDGTVRISPGWITSEEDIARCASALIEIAEG